MKYKPIKLNSYTLFKFIFTALFLFSSTQSFAQIAPAHGVTKLFKTHCAECHQANRLGGVGPVLLPENLKYLRKPAATNVIRNGRAKTLMPAFKSKLSDNEIQSLVEFIYTPLTKIPGWDIEKIKASHIIHNKQSSLPDKPLLDVKDQLNVFLVVERGDHHVTLLDGDTFEPVHRFKSRFALYGEPQFSPSGRFVY